MATWADLLQGTLVLSIPETVIVGTFHESGISRRLRQFAGEAGES